MELVDVFGVLVPHRVVRVDGDGSCFFYSMSYLVYGTASRAPQVRANVVGYVRDNWRRFQPYTMKPCGDAYATAAEYEAQMSVHTTYATTCEIQAASELYPYLVVYRDGAVIFQPNEYAEGKSVHRMKCTGPMMSAHFEPLIPIL